MPVEMLLEVPQPVRVAPPAEPLGTGPGTAAAGPETGAETGAGTGAGTGADTATGIGAEAGAAALRDLVAAGLVSHEAIGDPARLAGETASLRALCGLVAGPVYRLAPFHYAFAVRDGDLDGVLAGLAPPAVTAALDAALAAVLGPDAVWLGATQAGAPDTVVDLGAAGLPDAPLLVLRAREAATAAGIAAAGPGLQAVIDADYAVACARLTAGADPAGPLDRRLAALEAGMADLRAALGAEAAAAAHRAEDLAGTLTRTLAVLERLDARDDAAAAFHETLGATLAEFLARIERREAEARAPRIG